MENLERKPEQKRCPTCHQELGELAIGKKRPLTPEQSQIRSSVTSGGPNGIRRPASRGTIITAPVSGRSVSPPENE